MVAPQEIKNKTKSNPVFEYTSKGNGIILKTYLQTHVCSSITHNINVGRQPQCPSVDDK